MMSWLRPKSTRDTQARIDRIVAVELPAADRACQKALDSEDDANAWAVADKHRSELQTELRRLRDLLPGQSQREKDAAEAATRIVNVDPPRPFKPERFEPLVGSPPPFGGSDLRQRPGELDDQFRDRQRGIIGWRHCPAEGDPSIPYRGIPRWVLPAQRPDLMLQLKMMEGR